MVYEGEDVRGTQAIVEKLTSLPYSTIQHSPTSNDCTVTVSNGLLVMVVGKLKADEDILRPSFSSNNYGDGLFIMNDLFRLVMK